MGSNENHSSFALSVRVGAFDAGVLQASGDRLTVQFSARSTPPLRIGESVPLRFLDGGAIHGREAKGRVLSWRDRGDSRVVEFRTPVEIVTLACAGLGLRDDVRVSPGPGERLLARVRPRGRGAWSRTLLKDLSLTGIGVLVTCETDERLVDVATVDVELELPGGKSPVCFVGRIRFRGLAGCAIKHGLEIAPELTVEHDRVLERLRQYSLERQRELLQSARLKASGGGGPLRQRSV